MEQQPVEIEPSFTLLNARQRDAFEQQMSAGAYEQFLDRCRLVEELALDILPADNGRFLRTAEDVYRALSQIDRVLRMAHQQKGIPEIHSRGLNYDLAYQLLKRDALAYMSETIGIPEEEKGLILEGLGPLYYLPAIPEHEAYQRALSEIKKEVVQTLRMKRAVEIENALARYAMDLLRIQHETPYTAEALRRHLIQQDDSFLNASIPWVDYNRRGSPLGLMSTDDAMDTETMNRVEPHFQLSVNH